MKNAKLVPLLAMGILIAAGPAMAQLENRSIMANVPFSFRAGDRLLPAGEYRVSAVRNTGVLALSGAQNQLVGTHGTQSSRPSSSTKLIFNKVGGSYFLSQIWLRGQQLGMELPRSRMQKEMAKAGSFETVSVVAQK